MPTYLIIRKRDSDRTFWEPARAKTLLRAKREATVRYAGDYIDSTICIGYQADIGSPIQTIARRTIPGRWINEFQEQ